MRIPKIIVLAFCGLAAISLAQESPEQSAKQSAKQSAEQSPEPAVIEELSQEELDAEMERIEQALSDTEELKEFVPSKPLAADLPVSLPSDI